MIETFDIKAVYSKIDTYVIKINKIMSLRPSSFIKLEMSNYIVMYKKA